MSEKSIYATLAVIGFAVTFAVSFASEREEAWDSALYFTVGLPVMALAAGFAGFHHPERTWSFGFAVVAGSMAWMFAARGIGSLFPLGLVFAVMIALACGGAAWLGAALRRRLDRRV